MSAPKVPPVVTAAVPIATEPAKELSFEEEMALRKKQYYESKTTTVEEKAAAPPPAPMAAPSPTPQKQPDPVPGKITLKFESPFGKKKIDPLRTILDTEEASAAREENAPWKSR
jgi:hypothetical protein